MDVVEVIENCIASRLPLAVGSDTLPSYDSPVMLSKAAFCVAGLSPTSGWPAARANAFGVFLHGGGVVDGVGSGTCDAVGRDVADRVGCGFAVAVGVGFGVVGGVVVGGCDALGGSADGVGSGVAEVALAVGAPRPRMPSAPPSSDAIGCGWLPAVGAGAALPLLFDADPELSFDADVAVPACVPADVFAVPVDVFDVPVLAVFAVFTVVGPVFVPAGS